MNKWIIGRRPIKSWGWYSETVAKEEAVFIYRTPSGDRVHVTQVSSGYEPINPYTGWIKDSVFFVGEVTKYVGIYTESMRRINMMSAEDVYKVIWDD